MYYYKLKGNGTVFATQSEQKAPKYLKSSEAEFDKQSGDAVANFNAASEKSYAEKIVQYKAAGFSDAQVELLATKPQPLIVEHDH